MDCQSGCTVPREHLASCPDPAACRGCLPREAADGIAVCQRCQGRLHDALVRLPDLVEHIRSHVTPGAARLDAVHVRGSRTPPAPLSLAAVDDADALHAMVASWCTEVMDGRDVRGPVWAGTMLLPAAKRTRVPGRHRSTCPAPDRCAGCAVAYVDARAFGLASSAYDADEDAADRPAAVLVGWLTRHLDWCLTQDWAADLVADVTDQVHTLAARWAMTEQAVSLKAPCPACDRLTLKRFAPAFYRGQVSIRCAAKDCGEPIPEDRYGLYTRIVVAARAFEDPVAAHLYRLEVAKTKPAQVYVVRRALRALGEWLAADETARATGQTTPLLAAPTTLAAWTVALLDPDAVTDQRLDTARRRLAAVRGFYSWAVTERLLDDDPTVGLEVVDPRDFAPLGGAA